MAPTFGIENQMANVRGATNTDKLTVAMIEPLLDQGYHLYVDNWYTSLRLFKYLDEHETPACGTLRKNRVPRGLRDVNMQVDETKALRSDNILVLKYRAKLKKYVNVMTTIHNEATSAVNVRGRHQLRVNKPLAIQEYNKYMGGVDRMDQVSFSNFFYYFMTIYFHVHIPCI